MAKTGAPPAWNLLGKNNSLPFHQAVRFGTQNRVTVPPQVRQRVSWISASRPIHCLATFLEPGLVRIESPQRLSDLNEAIEEWLEEHDAGEESEEFALSIQRRQVRLSIDKEWRIIFPTIVVDWIDPDIFEKIPFYITAYDDRFYFSSRDLERHRIVEDIYPLSLDE